MKENKKKASVLVREAGTPGAPPLPDAKKSGKERLKKPAIFLLMGIVFLGCLYLIFNPATDQAPIENVGLNGAVPQASEAGMQADKQKAYEQEMLEDKNQEKRNALTVLSDYWNEDSTGHSAVGLPKEEEEETGASGSSVGRPENASLQSYRGAQHALGSFYQDSGSETASLRRQLDALKEKLAEKEVPKSATFDDQLALMEKSYQMAAKYLPTGTSPPAAAPASSSAAAVEAAHRKAPLAAMPRAAKNPVSFLSRAPADSAVAASWNQSWNRELCTPGAEQQELQPKNSISACVHDNQTVVGETGVRLRLLEDARTPHHTIPRGTLLTANARFQNGRLQLQVTSITLGGAILPAALDAYDLDGQQGLVVPYSQERSALAEMAANMGQASGTSLTLTRSAGQQAAADLSRGLVQGVSGYFSKKVRTPKVTLKAGHQVFLVPKK